MQRLLHRLCVDIGFGLSPGDQAALALVEIDHLVRRDDLTLTALGVLTAAGPLAVEDLATLTSAPATSAPGSPRRISR
jgi:hypothetical protein